MRPVHEQSTVGIITAIEQGADRYVMPWQRAGSGLSLAPSKDAALHAQMTVVA